jgi:hypothetical protein
MPKIGRNGAGCQLTAEQESNLRRLPRQAGRIVVGDPDQLFGVAKRERAEQQCVDDAEDRGARADAEPDDHDGEDGEARVAPQRAKRLAQVLPEPVENAKGESLGVSLDRVL